MTYRRSLTLGEVTQELEAIKGLFEQVSQRQADAVRRLEYVEDALEAVLSGQPVPDKPKKDKP